MNHALSKLLYASPAWWGFTSATDKQRIEASVRRAIRLGLYTADTMSQLAADMDDNLFMNIQHNLHHVLHKFLPYKTGHIYNLRSRRHSLSLTVKTDCNNFLNRLLFKDKLYINCYGCVLSTVLKK